MQARRSTAVPPTPRGAALARGRARLLAAAYLLLLPLVPLALAHRLLIRRKALVGLGEKLGGLGPRPRPGRVLVHGVSLGEVQLMRPLLPRLEAALGERCLLSTTTETGRAALDRHFPAHERVFLPFDLPWAVDRFLRRCRPRAVVLLELELWPYLLLRCRALGIPVLIANARLSARSRRGYARAMPLLRPIFRSLQVLAQNDLWARRFRSLGVPAAQLTVCGSLKADIITPADAAAAQAEAQRIGYDRERPGLLIASTSAEEEEPLLRSWLRWGRAAGWQCVVCPRHPERGPAIEALCRRLDLPAVRTGPEPTAPPPLPPDGVTIVDEIGRLPALYALARIAAVGGSFGSGRHGQNMLEAAAAGCATVVGWDTSNFPDAMAILRQAEAVCECRDAADIHPRLAALAADPPRCAALAQRGHATWAANRGAIDRVAERLAALLPPG